MGKALTPAWLEGLRTRPPEVRRDYPDGKVPGLHLRVTPAGTMTWSLQYRIDGTGGTTERGHELKGPERYRVTIGRWPAVSIKAARARASRYVAMVERGENPTYDLEQQANAARGTVEALAEDFLERYVRANGLRSAWKVEKLLQVHVLPRWGRRPITTITRRDAVALLGELAEPSEIDGRRRGGPTCAADTRATLHRMFEWACEQDRLGANPISGVKNPVRLRPRRRVLSMDEIRAVWRAASTLGYPFGPVYQLLMLTACRKGEIGGARWPWLDLGERQMTIPAEDYKTGQAHLVLLSDPAVEIVAGLPRWNAGEYIFSTSSGVRPVSGWSRAKQRLDAAVAEELDRPLENWRIHDLRRTVRTELPRLGVTSRVAERVLGHVVGGIEGTYDRYDYLNEKRAALDLWAQELLE